VNKGGFDWQCSRFEDLGVQRLYDVLALRCRVFILEQGAYQDPDGVDQQSWHLMAWGSNGRLLGYLRIVDPGLKYAEPSIGRVLTAPEARGTGLGRSLMNQALARCGRWWPGSPVRMSAQARLRRFYGELGFVAASDEYLEDNIPHLQMLWTPPRETA
jgi:ElaA protein